MRKIFAVIGLALALSIAATARADYGAPAPAASNASAFQLPGATLLNLHSTALGLGFTNLYTVPAGSRLFVPGCVFYNSSVNTVNARMYVRIGSPSGEIRLLTAPADIGTTGSAVHYTGIVLEAGDILVANAQEAGTVSVNCSAQLYSSSVAFYSPRLVNPGAGDNVLYTVPAGKTANIWTPGSSIAFFAAAARGTCLATNETGASRSAQPKLTPSGEATVFFAATVSVANSTRSEGMQCPNVMQAGDVLTLNLPLAATQALFWILVQEFP